MSSPRRHAAHRLATTLRGAQWNLPALRGRADAALDPAPPWVEPLLAALLARFPPGTPPAPEPLTRFIADQTDFDAAWREPALRPRIRAYPLDAVPMAAAPHHAIGPLPDLAAPGDLAAWLGLRMGELGWFADPEGRQRRLADGPLCHYRYRWLARRRGPPRLLEIPKARLKAFQRRILTVILDRIPPHPAAHGFRRGHSCLDFATPHAGRHTVIRLDLRDFFVSIPARRVHALFRTLGYPWEVARLLTGLCCHAAPTRITATATELDWRDRRCLAAPHLPQGAPTSPALANLCAFRLDARLAGLAKHWGLHYGRYADDLAFSSDRIRRGRVEFLVGLVGAIALEEGFALNQRKTRVMPAAHAQRLVGLSINRFPNLPREDHDRLKATLYNCVRHGPTSQNRDGRGDFRAHLEGRIAYVEGLNPGRGQRLRRLFERIAW